MKKQILLTLVLISIVLISGCVEEQSTGRGGNTGTEMTMNAIEYNFYGKLIDYTYLTDEIILEVDTTILNCEKNTERVSVRLDVNEPLEQDFIVREEYMSCLESGMTTVECEEQVYNMFSFSELCLETEKFGDSFLYMVKCTIDLDSIIGKDYVFSFLKTSEDIELWSNARLNGENGYSDIISYKEEVCKPVHKDDLKINELTNVEGSEDTDDDPATAPAQRIISTIINIGETTEIGIQLENYQFNDITYKILNADIRTAFANDVEEVCQVTFDSTENTIIGRESSLIPYTTEILTFNVLCDNTVEKESTRESCDINGDNCQTITTPNQFILWGEIQFTDELNNLHIVPEHRKLKHHIDII
ncbi:MAG: hypothetical protein KJ906_00175 [Nanoarchaeota archaeon]|nr:hypothetical protein [Nanoarchaeota archaeon]